MDLLNHYFIQVTYIGTEYKGWQVQPDQITIQSQLQDAVSKFLNQPTKVLSAMRTDSGVHAIKQPVCFKTEDTIDEHGFLRAMRCFLPKDISVVSIKLVEPNYNLFNEVKNKTYIYKIWNHPDIVCPFVRPYVWHLYSELNISYMRQAANFLVGRHDFTSFCATDSNAKCKNRTINSIKIVKKEDLIEIFVNGDGFLKQMVRNIVGMLVDVGLSKIDILSVEKVLNAKDRKLASQTAPAKGLCLHEVHYH